ncbi:MAG TPA: glycoside hydrolase family 18 protein [Telluria sp.]|jgi:chitinase
MKRCALPVLTFLLGLHSAGATEVGSYYTAWSAEEGFRLKQFDQSGAAARFTYLNYSFGNVYKMADGSFRCDSGRDVKEAGDGTGMRSTADYARRHAAAESVDGSADQAQQPLAGNFNQLRQLKRKHPQLKVMIALGGYQWSRYFSDAAASADSRRTLVASCIDTYILGNLTPLDGHGGKGTAAGLFDGIDIDWEYPGVPLMAYNSVSPKDKGNFTLLLAEFRKQLDALGKRHKKHYYLTAALNSGQQTTDASEPARFARSLDWVNLMTYDFHGAWNKTGPADFHSNLYADPASPDPTHPSVDSGVTRMIKAGIPARKIVIGVPFYARGWSGVGPANNGLYQSATGPATGFEEGAERYGRIAKASAPVFRHPVTKQLWTYQDNTFWSYDDPAVIADKVAYLRQRGLGGIMSWALDQDDAAFSLSHAMGEAKPKK